MSTIITVNSLEQNIGVSSVVLTLSEKINFYTKKRTCIVELDYENPSFSYILEKTPIGIKNIDNIFPFINNDTIVDDSLLSILDFNVQSFKNSNIDILYGSKKGETFNNSQLNVFISALRKKYEIIIIDYGNKIIPDILMDNTDINLLVVQPSLRYLENLYINKRDYVHKKTKFLINKNVKGVSEIFLMLKEKFNDSEIFGQLPLSENLINRIMKGLINVEKGEYNLSLTKLVLKICKYLSLEIKVKNTLTEILLGKLKNREDNVSLATARKLSLEEILIKENICTKEDIERCLEIQAKRLNQEDGNVTIL